ncbi:hypothetical protein [Desulfomonile tiedjei]|uniref:Uncharacterized protein n=1 Tax=Desulfomonile tiedjei (strain ATCC 49306 / DSM 6799 / DCB-1) TaxID=706587 RepID=I4C2C5_DESTA|nr:hypothetical protein [Desulfomonile tiedjei]AFM23716.1 hypothetical protein Desti_0998 [Desulfomonile tiedjei DSM 6799]
MSKVYPLEKSESIVLTVCEGRVPKPAAPFGIPADIHDHLMKISSQNNAPAWERYANPEKYGDWPDTVEVFNQWCKRHSGIFKLIEAAGPRLRFAECDYSEESMELLVGTLNAIVNQLGPAFDDLKDLIQWATVAWEHDPAITDSVDHENNENPGGES